MTEDHPKDDLTRERDDGPTGDVATTTANTADERARSDLLGHVRRVETIADRVDFETVRTELPDGWELKPDLVQFGSAPLAETVVFEGRRVGRRILLKPVDDAEPTGEIEVYERIDPRRSRRVLATVDSLSAALRAAVNRAHQLDRG